MRFFFPSRLSLLVITISTNRVIVLELSVKPHIKSMNWLGSNARVIIVLYTCIYIHYYLPPKAEGQLGNIIMSLVHQTLQIITQIVSKNEGKK